MKNRNYLIKTIAGMILALALCLPATAQDREEVSTLFGGSDGNIDHGGWGGLTFGYTQIKGEDTYLMGARGGWLIDHHFTVGLAGAGFISDHEYVNYDINEGNPYNIAGGYGGLFLEALIAPFYPVHIAIPLTIGAGGITYTDQQWWTNDDWDEPYTSIASDAFFVIEPGLEVEVNLVKFMRLGVGGSYRYTSKVNMGEGDSDMLRGFNGYFTLKFGWF